MRTLGRNMAWLLKSIDAGKAHGILAPAAEPKTRTNFIRKCEPVKKEDEEKNFAPYFISYKLYLFSSSVTSFIFYFSFNATACLISSTVPSIPKILLSMQRS